MGKKKLEVTRHLQRIAAIPHNPYLEEEVQKLRQEYAIPTDGEEARNWLFYLEYELKYNEWGYPELPQKAHDWLRESKKLGTTLSLLETKKMQNIFPVEFLVAQETEILLHRFRLPWYVFHNLHLYILTGDKTLLDPSRFAVFNPKVEFEYTSIPKGLPGWKATITGLTPWTTKKQWEKIWQGQVKERIEEIKRVYEQVEGVAEPVKKRATVEAYREQMERWSEWYQLSEIQGLGPTKALDKWEAEHSDESRKFDQSTVTHAIKEFQEIITSLPVDSLPLIILSVKE